MVAVPHNAQVAEHRVEFDRTFNEHPVDRAILDFAGLELSVEEEASAFHEKDAPRLDGELRAVEMKADGLSHE
jgi:hypothetical protein